MLTIIQISFEKHLPSAEIHVWQVNHSVMPHSQTIRPLKGTHMRAGDGDLGEGGEGMIVPLPGSLATRLPPRCGVGGSIGGGGLGTGRAIGGTGTVATIFSLDRFVVPNVKTMISPPAATNANRRICMALRGWTMIGDNCGEETGAYRVG
jgi:hypothetical protein